MGTCQNVRNFILMCVFFSTGISIHHYFSMARKKLACSPSTPKQLGTVPSSAQGRQRGTAIQPERNLQNVLGNIQGVLS